MQRLRKITAVILLMIVRSKLLAVVASTHKISLAAGMTIIGSTISWTITITLSIVTRILRCTTSATVVVSASTSLV